MEDGDALPFDEAKDHLWEGLLKCLVLLLAVVLAVFCLR